MTLKGLSAGVASYDIGVGGMELLSSKSSPTPTRRPTGRGRGHEG